MRTLALIPLVAMLCACGDDAAAPEEPSDPPAILSFAPIAGAWEGLIPVGDGFDTFWVSFNLDSSAQHGTVVGTIVEGGSQGVVTCTGDLVAVEVSPPVYWVLERIETGNCPNGLMRLEHDPTTQTLGYQWAETRESTPRWVGVVARP